MTVVQLNLEGTCRSDKKARPPKLLESALQQQIRGTLANVGYSSEEIGAARIKLACTCPNCGKRFEQYPEGKVGNTTGTPDLQVYRMTSAFPPVGIRLEVKTEKGGVRPAQEYLAQNGRSLIVRSVGDAVEAVRRVEQMLTEYQTPAAQIERLSRLETKP